MTISKIYKGLWNAVDGICDKRYLKDRPKSVPVSDRPDSYIVVSLPYRIKNNEIDFVLQYGTEIIPIEAKGGEDKSAPSFKRYIADHEPDHAIRFSKRGYRKDGYITNLPLYLARKTKDLL